MNKNAEIFIHHVGQFCEWAEGSVHGLSDARRHLIALMGSIPLLEEFHGMDTGEQTYPRRGIEGWKTDHKSLSDLPFQYYVSVFDPHDFEALDEPVTGDLHDDFADIYGDLWHGLQIYRAGNIQAALSRWVDSYFYHWGHHASSALRAIDHYYCQEKLANEDRE